MYSKTEMELASAKGAYIKIEEVREEINLVYQDNVKVPKSGKKCLLLWWGRELQYYYMFSWDGQEISTFCDDKVVL